MVVISLSKYKLKVWAGRGRNCTRCLHTSNLISSSCQPHGMCIIIFSLQIVKLQEVSYSGQMCSYWGLCFCAVFSSALYLPVRLLVPVRAPGCKELRHFHQQCGLAGARTQSSLPDHNILGPCVHHTLTPVSPCMYSVDRAEGRGEEQQCPQAKNPLQWSQVL